MDIKEFSKKELVDILELIHLSFKCKTETEVIGIISRLKELVCADTGICALGETKTGSLIKILNFNYPEEWKCIYTAEKLYINDPVILFNFKFQKTHFWSEAIQAFPNNKSLNVMNRAAEFGLKKGVTSGIIEKKNDIGSVLSFSSRLDTFKNHQKKILDIISPYIHQALIRLYQSSYKKDISNISRREGEVLNWVKEGKTNWEISVILSISERTVKFHVQNIVNKLDAVSKTHALAIAMGKGLI